MKKLIAKKLIAILLTMVILFSVTAIVHAFPSSAIFTHPEIGEQMTVGFEPSTPFFQIYGFYYYRFMGIQEPYRGLTVPQDLNVLDNAPDVYETLSTVFQNINKEKDTNLIQSIDYIGIADTLKEKLEALLPEEKAKAAQILFGFEGRDAYNMLLSFPGFTEDDVASLKTSYFDYSIRLNEKLLPFRVFMHYVEERDWDKSYFEKYSFVKIANSWKLLHITREYTNSYKERSKYIHGYLGSNPEDASRIHDDLLLGAALGMDKSDILSAVPKAKKQGNKISFDTELFFIPAKAEFIFKNDKLMGASYSLEGLESYYSLFISLYMRYIDPVAINENGDMIWSLNDVVISLNYNDANPTISIEHIK